MGPGFVEGNLVIHAWAGCRIVGIDVCVVIGCGVHGIATRGIAIGKRIPAVGALWRIRYEVFSFNGHNPIWTWILYKPD